MASNVLCQYPGTAFASLVNSQLMACWDWPIWPNISLWRAQEWRAAPSVLQPLNTLLAKQDKEVEAQMCRQISQQLLSVSNTALLGCPLMATLATAIPQAGEWLERANCSGFSHPYTHIRTSSSSTSCIFTCPLGMLVGSACCCH